jgi:L-2,4-diaminobutyric acid acetyltransferase
VPQDGRAIWRLAAEAGLDLNSAYAYVMWAEYHAATSLVAADGTGSLAGFVMGFRVPDRPHAVFVWQIAVATRCRGIGLGSHLLDALARSTGAAAVEATVTPSNAASAALFRGLAQRHGTTAEEHLLFDGHLFPDGHEPEVRFRIPLAPGTPTRPTIDLNED